MRAPQLPKLKVKKKKAKKFDGLKPMMPGGKVARGGKKMSTMLNTGRVAKDRGLPY